MPDPPSRHRLECAVAAQTSEPGLSNWRKRAPEDVAVEVSLLHVLTRERGRQYRVRGDVRARLLGEL